MAKLTRYHSVDFGGGASGLSTVGYTLYNASDGSEHTARSTTNVTELGSSGVYATNFSVDHHLDLYVVWDDGEGTPTYAVENSFGKLNSIKEETDKVRTIWNTIQQNADYQGELMLKMAGLQENLDNIPHPEVMEKVLKTMKDDLFNSNDKMVEMVNGQMISRFNELSAIVKSIVVVDPTQNIKAVMDEVKAIQNKHDNVMSELNKIEFDKFQKGIKNLENLHKLDEVNKVKNELAIIIRKFNAFYLDSVKEQRGVVGKLQQLINSRLGEIKSTDERFHVTEMETLKFILNRVEQFFNFLKLERQVGNVDQKAANALNAVNKLIQDMDNKKLQSNLKKNQEKMARLKPLLQTLKGVK